MSDNFLEIVRDSGKVQSVTVWNSGRTAKIEESSITRIPAITGKVVEVVTRQYEDDGVTVAQESVQTIRRLENSKITGVETVVS